MGTSSLWPFKLDYGWRGGKVNGSKDDVVYIIFITIEHIFSDFVCIAVN
jgi:hypothetical protein